MRDLNSTEYYRCREQKSRALAQAAAEPAIAAIHLEMATQYSLKIAAATPALRLVRQALRLSADPRLGPRRCR